MRRLVLFSTVVVPLLLGWAAPAHAAGTWTWPVAGPVVRGFDPPDDPYGSGHRGIDIAAPAGSPVVAADAGTVTFAGRVGGELFVSVRHAAGLATTYAWLSSVDVSRDQTVLRGQEIARSGGGHPGSVEPSHLHLGAKLDGSYIDPLLFLAPMSVAGMIRLAPLIPAA